MQNVQNVYVVIAGGLYRRGSKAWRFAKTHLVHRNPKPIPAPKPIPSPGPVTMFMYDDVNVSLIPKNAQAVAGYVGGHWPTYPTLVKLFPKAHKLSIAVNASEDAECLDIEPGDAVPAQAAAWIRRQKARGVKKPVVYTSAAYLQALVDTLAKAGIPRTSYRVWSAHYTGRAHFCSSACGFGIKVVADATQFTDRAEGRSLDESICSAQFFS